MDPEVVQKIQAALGCGRLGRGHFNRGGTGVGWGGDWVTCQQPRKHKKSGPWACRPFQSLPTLVRGLPGEGSPPNAMAHCLEHSTNPNHPHVGAQHSSLLGAALKQTP